MPGVEQVLENLWTRLADEETAPGPLATSPPQANLGRPPPV
jgi:hypothetical protein